MLAWKVLLNMYFEIVNEMIKKQTNGRAWVKLVEVRENEKNSAIYLATN